MVQTNENYLKLNLDCMVCKCCSSSQPIFSNFSTA